MRTWLQSVAVDLVSCHRKQSFSSRSIHVVVHTADSFLMEPVEKAIIDAKGNTSPIRVICTRDKEIKSPFIIPLKIG